jgi:hypothetical protein
MRKTISVGDANDWEILDQVQDVFSPFLLWQDAVTDIEHNGHTGNGFHMRKTISVGDANDWEILDQVQDGFSPLARRVYTGTRNPSVVRFGLYSFFKADIIKEVRVAAKNKALLYLYRKQ